MSEWLPRGPKETQYAPKRPQKALGYPPRPLSDTSPKPPKTFPGKLTGPPKHTKTSYNEFCTISGFWHQRPTCCSRLPQDPLETTPRLPTNPCRSLPTPPKTPHDLSKTTPKSAQTPQAPPKITLGPVQDLPRPPLCVCLCVCVRVWECVCVCV